MPDGCTSSETWARPNLTPLASLLASVTVTETLCPTSNATVEANKLTNASVGLQCDYRQQKTDA